MNTARNRLLMLAGVPILALTGCKQASPPSGQATQSAANAAAPEAKPGLALTDGRLVLPAVRDNPGAAYFTLTNGSDQPAVIADVSVAGAGMAMLHETRSQDGHSTMTSMAAPQVPARGSLVLAPGGGHLMVDAVPAGLKPGQTVELTITFDGGDKLSAPLTVVAPGGA